MLRQVIAYLKFWLKSKNQHGVHSPFVYNLVTKCFYDNKKYNEYSKLKLYRALLLSNNNSIQITELGAGSKTSKSNTRVISKIAKNAGSTKQREKLFYRFVNYFQFKNILELGTSLGIATHAIQLGNPKAKITTIEGCPNISTFTKSTFKQFNLNNIELLTGDFSNVVKPLKSNAYDLIYFDGNHQKQATIHYFKTLLPTVSNDTVFIFDDIYWSKDMTEAWNQIKKHPQVTVTIDLFFCGMVFFRKEQEKEHFTIRI
ncbi:MAG: class I SAM-dependent methyltransferase [Lacinutrix sp.]|uniref:O-methyltransferase n=1 Tax=Lacinutrix sp. TaxID=1937692 RepID=UPI0030992A8D